MTISSASANCLAYLKSGSWYSPDAIRPVRFSSTFYANNNVLDSGLAQALIKSIYRFQSIIFSLFILCGLQHYRLIRPQRQNIVPAENFIVISAEIFSRGNRELLVLFSHIDIN